MGKDQEFLEAARNGNITFIEKILNQKIKRSGPLASLRRGPGINAQDNGGYSALHYAALNGHTDIVRLLLIHEASPNILDSRGSSPLHLAAWAGHQEIVKMLLTHPYKPANPDMQTMENETPLHCAAQHGHTGALTTLLAHSADPNVCNSRNETPLDLAAQYGRLQAVQMLIRAHPELLQPYSLRSPYDTDSQPTVVTHSALHLASRNGHNSVVEVLLAAGVNVNLLTPSGTALHEAALCGKDVVVRTLLEAGADLNATDSEGRTPLDILREFPPHVTKGIISVINSFRTRYDDIDEAYSFDQDERLSNKKPDGSVDGCSSKDTPTREYARPEYDPGVSPSVSINSFDQSLATSSANQFSTSRASNDNFPEFYIKMAPIRIQKSAPKKPPRRNLSISPTHMQNFFPCIDLEYTGDMGYCDSESKSTVPESSKHAQNSISHGDNGSARVSTRTCGSSENLIETKKAVFDTAQKDDNRPIPAPRKLKSASYSCNNAALRSYNPNRKLKRNRENYFDKGQFSLTISTDEEQFTLSPTPANDDKASHSHLRRPLSQEYACSPDSMLQHLGFEGGNLSQDQHPLCLSVCNSSGSISSGVSLSDRSVSTDCVEEFVGDEPFAGLFKGSTINLNNENLNYPNSNCSENHRLEHARIQGTEDRTECSQAEGFVNRDRNSENKGNLNTRNGLESTKREISSCLTQENGRLELKNDRPNSHLTANASNENKSNNSKEVWQQISDIMETFGNTVLNSEGNWNRFNSCTDLDETDQSDDHKRLTNLLDQHGLGHLDQVLFINGYDSYRFMNGIFDERDLSIINISGRDAHNLVKFIKKLPHAKFAPILIESSLDSWLKSINLLEYSDRFKKHLYNSLKSVCGVWEIELQTVLEISKVGHRKRILYSVAQIKQGLEVKRSSENIDNKKCEATAQSTKGTLRQNKKNRPAPKPPLVSLEIRAPSELLIGLPSNLRMRWPHSASALVSHFLKYEVYYLGSTVVKELRGTESTRKSIQKLKRAGQFTNSDINQPTKSSSNHYPQAKKSLVQLSISYRGVEFLDIETNGTICEHEIRNINCACQDADDMRHFAYITKDSDLNTHYCHVFNVDNMHLAMEIILTLAESFEVAYQMALRNTPLTNSTLSDLN